MGVQSDGTGRRWVEVEAEVPGTPEEVWEAIASGPGISSWFVPAEFETGEDGKPKRAILHFGPGNSMDSISEITEWDPPRRYTATSADWGPDAPKIATEWSVKAETGSTCVIRVVHSLFADTDDWDNQIAGTEEGWPWFFQILGLYLAKFRGQPCKAYRVMGAAPGTAEEAWNLFAPYIGVLEAEPGQVCRSADGMPPLVGTARKKGEGGHSNGAIVRLDEPAAGILSTFSLPMGGTTYVVMDVFHYGKMAESAVEKWQPRWQAWMNERFPMPEEEGAC